jgi:hypothetical protein
MTPEYEIRDDTIYVPEHPRKKGDSVTPGDGKITIIQGGVEKGTFTVNQFTDTIIELDSGAALSQDYKNESGKDIGSIKAGETVLKGTTFEDFVERAFKAPPKIHASKITLDKHTLDLKVKETDTLIATVEPEDIECEVVWTSSDPSIATVVNGVVTSIAEGVVTITASIDSVSDSCTVTVTAVSAELGKLYYTGTYNEAIKENDDAGLDVLEAERSGEVNFQLVPFDPYDAEDKGLQRFFVPKEWFPLELQVFSGGKYVPMINGWKTTDATIDDKEYVRYESTDTDGVTLTRLMKLIFKE